MWSSFFHMFTRIFTAITRQVDSVERVLDIGNLYIEEAHKSAGHNFKKAAIRNTATQHAVIQAELEADPKLAKIFADLEKEW